MMNTATIPKKVFPARRAGIAQWAAIAVFIAASVAMIPSYIIGHDDFIHIASLVAPPHFNIALMCVAVWWNAA